MAKKIFVAYAVLKSSHILHSFFKHMWWPHKRYKRSEMVFFAWSSVVLSYLGLDFKTVLPRWSHPGTGTNDLYVMISSTVVSIF